MFKVKNGWLDDWEIEPRTHGETTLHCASFNPDIQIDKETAATSSDTG